jgi:hypothetical protein
MYCIYLNSQSEESVLQVDKLNPQIKVSFVVSPTEQPCFEESIFLSEMLINLILLGKLNCFCVCFASLLLFNSLTLQLYKEQENSQLKHMRSQP